MNSLTRIMSYDKTKINQENCNCEECVSVKNVESDNQITEYPKLSDEEIEQIIFERYSDKDDKTKIFIRKALRKHGDRYDYSNVIYVKAREKVEIICKVEGHSSFWQTPNAHLRRAGCPICNESQGSKRIRIFLSKNNIVFEQEKRFNDCRNIYPLPFDFYLPQYNLCIEFDGSCHFKKTNWNGEYTEEQLKENLESYQLRDQIKNDYCKSHNITLLRFNNLKTVEEELMKYFQEHGIIKEEGLFDLVS